MKKMMTTMALLMAGAVSADMLIGWDGSGSNTPTNETLNVSGIIFLAGGLDTARGSGDGWYGPDSTVAGGFSGASTAAGAYRTTEGGNRVEVQIQNKSGQDLELSTLIFDYYAIWATGPQQLEVSYQYGQLDDADGTLLTTLSTPGNSGNGTPDYADYSVNLQSFLTDYTLADGQNATFRFQGIDADNDGVNGLVDNIAFTGTVIPEPATIGLVCMVSGGLLFVRRRFCM
jgi:hypothetical protein